MGESGRGAGAVHAARASGNDANGRGRRGSGGGGSDGATIEVVGRYALCGEIAAGAMASVHFGRLLGPSGFSRPVAIKKLHPQLAKDPSVRAMFIDEARLAARICHPNVVPTLDVVEVESEGSGELMLVMEYVAGESLATLTRMLREKHQGVPIHVAVAIVASILHGLHAAHEARSETGEPLHILHRDVSPENVLVGVDGLARLLDFGIARAAARLGRTSGGLLKGKAAYMAPEQLSEGPMGRAVDVYAAGVVLWELLAGRRLFFKRDEGVIVEKIFTGRVDKPSTYAPDVSHKLDDLVMRAIDRNPAARFPTARELALALEALGPLPIASEIGGWVQRTAPEPLLARQATIERFERTSAKMRLTAARSPSGFPGVKSGTRTAASDAPYAMGHGAEAASTVRARRLSRMAWIAGTAAVSLVAGTTAWIGGRLAPSHDRTTASAGAGAGAGAATSIAASVVVAAGGLESAPATESTSAYDGGAAPAASAREPREKEKKPSRRTK